MYIPIIKTTQSEIFAVKHLEDSIKDKILPLFELTKSRSTKKLPEGDINKSYADIIAAFPGRKFILDLTTHDDLINYDIEGLYSESNGYDAWCAYIEQLSNPHIIPCIQISTDDPSSYEVEISKQVQRLSKDGREIAFRISYDDFEIKTFLDIIFGSLKSKNNLILILDSEYIRPMQANGIIEAAQENIFEISKLIGGGLLGLTASSFPRSVNQTGYGEDEGGVFNLEEVILYKKLVHQYPDLVWQYSDYASIHPKRYETKGGSWVPRIDVPLEEKLFYYRYRREDGGYRKVAKEVMKDKMFVDAVPCWGKNQIESCANNGEVGQSPSFWISVRANIHITTQALRIGRE